MGIPNGIEGGAGDAPPPRPLPAAPRFDPKRVYSALLFVPAFYLSVRYLPPAGFAGLVWIAGLLALYEFLRLFTKAHRSFLVVGGLSLSCLLAAALWSWPMPDIVFLVVLLALILPLIVRQDLSHSVTDSAVLLLGALYLGLALGYMVRLRSMPQGDMLIFFLFLVTWAGDTGAYYAGTLFGRHKLAPRISPKKSVEGLVGGLALAVLVAVAAKLWFLGSLTAMDCLMLGVALTAAGLAGDLAESALKRSAGAKDSGGLIPGHGGMLDRLDSLLFTAPAFYYYVTAVGRTAPLQ